MGWTFVWLMIGLKLPIAALLYLVHWAIKQTDEEPLPDSGDGGIRPPHRPRVPPHPRRRGPHGSPAVVPSAPRTRTPLAARARAAHGPHRS
jgi:hypothetical protein